MCPKCQYDQMRRDLQGGLPVGHCMHELAQAVTAPDYVAPSYVGSVIEMAQKPTADSSVITVAPKKRGRPRKHG